MVERPFALDVLSWQFGVRNAVSLSQCLGTSSFSDEASSTVTTEFLNSMAQEKV